MHPLERAARAIREQLAPSVLGDGTLLVEDKFSQADFRELARAVLTAIREPSAKMSRAGHLRLRDFDAESRSSYQTADQTFVAMIDAALHEGREQE